MLNKYITKIDRGIVKVLLKTEQIRRWNSYVC